MAKAMASWTVRYNLPARIKSTRRLEPLKRTGATVVGR